jgi:hypothetical protein
MKVYPPQTIVSPLTVVQRERFLPVPGEITVREGERVEPIQVIGRASAPAGFSIVNAARDLGVPASDVSKFLTVKPGETVKEGQVLAELRGISALLALLFSTSSRPCRSPLDGTVTDSGGGRILVEAFPREVELRANLYGVVARVLPGWGAVIRVSGALIQGVWGNDKESHGVLKLLVKSRTRPLRARSIDASCHGAILIGGSRVDTEALEKAAELQIRGVVTGGIPPEALPAAETAPFPIIVTEGIGDFPMCSRIYRLLSGNDGREATLSAHFQSRWGANRPEIIIPLPAEPEEEGGRPVDEPLAPGDTIRVIRNPHLGTVGTVKSFPAWARTTTGAQLPAAKVEPDGGEDVILVPLSNLEILR